MSFSRDRRHVGEHGGASTFHEDLHGTSSLRIPPAWKPELDKAYAYILWQQDVLLWAACSDLHETSLAPAIVLRLGGGARAIAREIPQDVLQNGADVIMADNTVRHDTGVTVLLRALEKKFAPLGTEMAISSIAEYLQLRMTSGESIDAYLARYDVSRYRAGQVGGLRLNEVGIAWHLLTSMGFGPEQWVSILAHNHGHLPRTDAELLELMQMLRRTGHVYEPSKHNIARPGSTFASSSSSSQAAAAFWIGGDDDDHFENQRYDSGWYDTSSSWMDGASYWYDDQDAESVYYDANSEAADDAESWTSSENEDEVDWGVYATFEDSNKLGEELFQDYVLSKKRWRAFTGRGPRRYRHGQRPQHSHRKGQGFGRKGKGKPSFGAAGKGFRPHSQRHSYYGGDDSFLPPGAMAGGKGKGKGKKGKGGSKGGNPRGPDGQPLKCSNCGSEQHLWRRCPQ
jgi:hypothetical protein